MATPITQSITRWRQKLDEDAQPIAESKNNPAAFSVLYDRYVQSIYRYLYFRIGSVPEAEDLTSQTFLAALEALPRYQHQGFLRPGCSGSPAARSSIIFAASQNRYPCKIP